MTPDELELLMAAAVDGTASAEDRQRLRHALESDPAAGKEYRQHCAMAAALEALGRPVDASLLPEEVRNLLRAGPAIAGAEPAKPIPRRKMLKVGFAAVACGLAGAGGGYVVGRRDRITQLRSMLQDLGLDKPVRTEGFLRKRFDTLLLSADIDKRSIQRVVFRPHSGAEGKAVYTAHAPGEGFAHVRVEHAYDLSGPWAGKPFNAEVEFIPFADLQEQGLIEPMVLKQEVLVSPTLGLLLDPGGQVRLFLGPPIAMESGQIHCAISGRSWVDGFVFVFLRPAGQPIWFLQNFGEPQQVKAGMEFETPCNVTQLADQFDVQAVVVQASTPAEMKKLSPFPPGKTEFGTIPNVDLAGQTLPNYGPVPFSVVRK
jgi:hypothetical protein